MKRKWAVAVVLAVAAAWVCGTARADVTYNVFINTAAVEAQSGWLEAQFNPGKADASPLNAEITGFQTDGQMSQQFVETRGDAVGPLPQMGLFENASGWNDLYQAMEWGRYIRFSLRFSGPGLEPGGASSGTAFAVSLWDAAGQTAFLTTDPAGAVVRIDILPDGRVTPRVFATPQGGPPVATVSLATSPHLGDVNNDGVVNKADVLLLLRVLGGIETAQGAYLGAGDMNGDGRLTLEDAALLFGA